MHRIPILAVAAALVAAPAAAAPPRQFLTKAIEGDNSEMRLGALAEQRAASPGVRDFGRSLQSDHAEARRQAVAVAQRMGVAPTERMAPEASAERRKLARLSGRAFDREFARYMVEDHRKDIRDFETQARGPEPQTAELARQTLPALRKHLDMARSLAAPRG